MNWGAIELDWGRFKVMAKQNWSKIAEEQFNAVAGRRDMLVRRVRDAYTIGADEAERQVADWQARLAEARPG